MLQIIFQEFQQLTSTQSKIQYLQKLSTQNLPYQINYQNLINYYQQNQ